jgi:PhoPQ-activated pathogenicity-related protein
MLMIYLIILLAIAQHVTATPLDDYVWTPDDHYHWELIPDQEPLTGRSIDGKHSWTGYLLNVTSQQWLTPEDVTQSIWWHVMCVIVPDNVKYKQNATMWVTGWSNTASLPTAHDEDIFLAASLAMNSGTITGSLFQIPNEKVVFSGDPEQMSRGEDAIIAYTWDHFLKDPNDPNWLVRLPMVKAVLRGMDAMTEFVAKQFPEDGYELDYYIIAGASKRGWTTWLMGAVDPGRVMAIVPIVLDAINFVTVEHHQYKSYNGWSYALEDYWHMNITGRFDDPNMLTLSQIEDPYYYFDRLTMPKMVVNAVGDEFQQPDDTHYWWDDLPEPKHFLMIPNAEHSLATGILEAVPAIGTWMEYLLTKKNVPKFTWELDQKVGTITVELEDNGVDEPLQVRKYYANTCAGNPRRDFRFINIDQGAKCLACGFPADDYCFNSATLWKFEVVHPVVPGGKKYVVHHDVPTDGTWAAFFVDVVYKKTKDLGAIGDNWYPGFVAKDAWGHLEFTTEVAVVPERFPYDDCHYEGCQGVLT